jgi:HD-GYP domain-containing protein (c-di-GMP phosphodiesterase class II)
MTVSVARTPLPLEEKLRRLELVQRISIALSAEHDRDRLIELILVEAKTLCGADGGTLYLRTDHDTLRFALLRNDSLDMALGGTTGNRIEQLPEMPLYDARTGQPNTKHVAAYAAVHKRTVNIPDAYHASGFDFSGTVAVDLKNHYRSKSFLTIPMVNNEDRVIGVLQLINARDPETGAIVAFDHDHEQIVSALASQAAIALENQQLLAQQRELLESFIQAIASAIDEKSPHTGSHCERVPVLTLLIAQAVIDETEGPLKDFELSPEQFYELKIAAWMHDCGKVTTPVHVIDKATKLETIVDRVHMLRTRFEVLRRDAELAHLKRVLEGQGRELSEARYRAELVRIDTDLTLVEEVNRGRAPLGADERAQIEALAARTYHERGVERPLLTEDEVKNLCIVNGTLTAEERVTINRHIVQTIRMLEALPFPRHLARVPEYAGGHHERMDGTGYPRGVYAGDMSIPARIMAIADVFEALTALDRPYKRAMKLSEAMRIMGNMKRNNHLDPDLFDVFVRSGVYRRFGERYLPPPLLDTVDEAALLAIEPKAFALPPESERTTRKTRFIAPYDE